MSQASIDRRYRVARAVGLAALLWTVAFGLGCGGALSGSANQPNGDPLHLGVTPGPLGSTIPQTIQVRLGSEPSDRIVSLTLTTSSLKTTNSGSQELELLTGPITVELTRSAIVTEPILIKEIYQDTYSNLIFPDMTGQVVFYNSGGSLVTQSLNISGQTITFLTPIVLGATSQVLNVSLDLDQTFTVNDNSITVNSPFVATTQAIVPSPPVAPDPGQPETGSINFLVGTVTTDVDTINHIVTLQPTSGLAMNVTYDGNTTFVNCSPSMLNGMMIQIDGATQLGGSVLASKIALIDNSQSSSELYGQLSGYATDGINSNLIAAGGAGVNVSTGLIGKSITLDWLSASYSVDHGRIPASISFFDEGIDGTLVFDESHLFPGQFVAVQWDSLVVPDPDSNNAGFMQPRMFELEGQTLKGHVFSYAFDATLQCFTFTLTVADDAAIKTMNPGLSISVRQIPQTYLRNTPTFADGDMVKVRGLLFADPNYNNANYHPPDPVAFIMVADRISK